MTTTLTQRLQFASVGLGLITLLTTHAYLSHDYLKKGKVTVGTRDIPFQVDYGMYKVQYIPVGPGFVPYYFKE